MGQPRTVTSHLGGDAGRGAASPMAVRDSRSTYTSTHHREGAGASRSLEIASSEIGRASAEQSGPGNDERRILRGPDHRFSRSATCRTRPVHHLRARAERVPGLGMRSALQANVRGGLRRCNSPTSRFLIPFRDEAAPPLLSADADPSCLGRLPVAFPGILCERHRALAAVDADRESRESRRR